MNYLFHTKRDINLIKVIEKLVGKKLFIKSKAEWLRYNPQAGLFYLSKTGRDEDIINWYESKGFSHCEVVDVSMLNGITLNDQGEFMKDDRVVEVSISF